jgi:cytochrome c oxidase assembly protein subunit 15
MYQNKAIKIWLLLCAVTVLFMIILGGYTRLSNAGLSIVEWKPVTGVIYPFNESMWIDEFTKYKSSPEYKYKNFNFSLEEFKQIYFIEYSHRLLGRVIGIIFIIPFFYFLFAKNLSNNLIRNLIVVFILGAVQGAVGWYMVKSGLSTIPEVSQYRLALHLLMALLIYGLLMWNFFSLLDIRISYYKSASSLFFGLIIFILIIMQIATGALMAGLDAGLTYNTYPLMDGKLVPDGMFIIRPWYLNIFENITTVQFIHRTLAVIILLFMVLYSVSMLPLVQEKKMKIALYGLLFFTLLQFSLGVLTLLHLVPVYLALLHQLVAILLFTNLLFVLNLLTYRN